jgi:branched-subunit amino acid aminotransferase/4-amino-4-deoxychorismate lyase
MHISLNGAIVPDHSFDWINDSGFRYGMGSFETIRLIHNQAPLISHHQDRITRSLAEFGIDYHPSGLMARIQALNAALPPVSTQDLAVRVTVTGGQMIPTPNTQPNSTEIITITPIAPLPASPMVIEFKSVTPTWFFKHKSLAYADHIRYLSQSRHWPVYLDDTHHIIDSSIFAIGIINNNHVIFSTHTDELPSVSRQQLLTLPNVTTAPLSPEDLTTADAIIGCNALRGVHQLTLVNGRQMTHHPRIESLNHALFFGINGGNGR